MLTGEARDAFTGVPIDAINTGGAISARVGVALVHVDLTVATRSTRLAATLVAADQVFTVASKLARIRLALIDLGLTNPAGVPWMTVAGKTVVSIDALATMARG